MENGIDQEQDDDVGLSPEDKLAHEHEELAKTIADNYREAADATKDWREEASRAFDYVACKQYTDQEIAEYNEQEKAPVTFNRAEVFVQTVRGLEALNRNEVKYSPRREGPVNQGESDLLNQAASYVNEGCDADSAHSDAFGDMVICGMGWSDTSLDYDENPQGDVVIEKIDPLSMYWSPRAIKRNVADSDWRMYIIETTAEEIRARWPDKELDYTGSEFAMDKQTTPHDATNAPFYHNKPARLVADNDTCWLVKYQYTRREKYVVIAGPAGQKEIPQEQYDTLLAQRPEIAQLPTARITKKVYRQAYCVGKTIMEDTVLDVGGFTLQCMTGKYDRNANCWYGLMRNLFDPQDWLNKLFSQIMFILSTNAKGGILAEYDAFENPNKAETEWARPDKITWVSPGALSGGKIQPKPMAEYPAGFDRLMQFSMSMFTDVTGQSLELMGLAERVQPGVLEAQRKQAGITILSWAFDALRSYRKSHGKIMAKFINTYIADGRLIKIVGEQGAQYIPLLRERMAMDFDIIVGESPTSPNQKERVFQILSQLLPTLQQMGIPIPKEILDYSPLPGALVETWKQQLAPNPQQQQQQQQEQAQAKQLIVAKQTADIAKVQADAALSTAKAEDVGKTRGLEVHKQMHQVEQDQVENHVKMMELAGFPRTPRGNP